MLTNLNYENEKISNVDNSIAADAWNKFLEIISLNISELKLNTWFRPIKAKHIDNDILTISVPSKDYYDMIISRFGDVVSKAAKSRTWRIRKADI